MRGGRSFQFLRSLGVTAVQSSSTSSARAQRRRVLVLAAAGLSGVALKPNLLLGREASSCVPTYDAKKEAVGFKAVDDYVQSGMVVGLGTGSTTYFAVKRLGEKLRSGELKDVIAIPTSERTKDDANRFGVPVATLDTHPKLDVAIDGADSVDENLYLVKGGGGAHMREKLVAAAAKLFVVIVDDSKLCKHLGPHHPIPVEIVPFCPEHTMNVIKSLPALEGCKPVLRRGNKKDADWIAISDNGCYIVDLHFMRPLKNPKAAAAQLKATLGVVEHGLFLNMASVVLIASKDGVTSRVATKSWFSRM